MNSQVSDKSEIPGDEDPYVPDIGIEYPSDPDERMLSAKDNIPVEVDENYPFLDKSLWFRIKSAVIYLGIFTIVFILSPLRYGLKIKGKENLRKNRKLFKNGAITVSNHVLRWDFLCVLQAVKYRRLYFPAWPGNLGGPDGG
ncbi:hypothetical protein K7I13_10820 [Brucepastera parasyntrophica]|uniref:hypothetical protein n=1 Tax=Brucepastera parasyntrophica TaxID=2880008 RepID=UPI00210E7BD3|nr:hypothetical protein [Brucepastera parasyntrophica]ULQ59003.1 hypothetical protein K7I13_10820 [Brucepastera parasyntrophica]